MGKGLQTRTKKKDAAHRKELRSFKPVAATLLVTPLLGACAADTMSGDDGPLGTGEGEEIAAKPASLQLQAKLARATEVDQHLQRTYFSRLAVEATTEGPHGEVVDWVAPQSLDPHYERRTPPPPSVAREGLDASLAKGAVEMTEDAPPSAARGADLQSAWDKVRTNAPEGTVPVVRPNFARYVSGESGKASLGEFLASRAKPAPLNPAQPQPAGQYRLYTSKVHTYDNIGTQGFIQYVNPAQVPSSGAFSLTQLATLCWGSGGGSTLEAIEVGFQKSPSIYGDNALHFFTFFRTNGGDTGDYVGGYNLDQAGFVTYGSAFPPGAVIPDPPSGQAHQRRIRTLLWNNAWWVQDWVSSSSYTWLGYYPIGTGAGQIPFDLIDDEACQTHWYGEVFDATPTSWHNGDLGNGVYGPTAGSLAFLEMIVENPSGNIWFNGTGTATDSACYDMTNVSSNGSTNWFNFGGPGGDAAGCN